MNQSNEDPFDSIENTREFLTLLAQTIYETRLDMEVDVEREHVPRRAEALKLALYTLSKLEFHMNRSRRILNDLRSLRRLLFEKRIATVQRIEQQPIKTVDVQIAMAARRSSPLSEVFRLQPELTAP